MTGVVEDAALLIWPASSHSQLGFTVLDKVKMTAPVEHSIAIAALRRSSKLRLDLLASGETCQSSRSVMRACDDGLQYRATQATRSSR